MERKLVTIVCADVAGYSRLIGLDEEGTIARLRAHRQTLIDPAIARHGGRIVKSMGDGLLVEFASPVEAVRCTAELQLAMVTRESVVPRGSADPVPDRHQSGRRGRRGRGCARRQRQHRRPPANLG